jgi:nicotinate-nucleotide adenylyltransferase
LDGADCKKPSRVGIFGGSFDPPHNGHLALAEHAAGALALDAVVFVPAAVSPLKGRPLVAAAAARMEMLEAALARAPARPPGAAARALLLYDCELTRGGVSYSYYTAAHLRARFPGAELFWLAGADQLARLGEWHRIDELGELVTFALARRAGSASMAPPPDLPKTVKIVSLPEFFMDVSSTQLRDAARSGDNAFLAKNLPAAVRAVIERLRLYR